MGFGKVHDTYTYLISEQVVVFRFSVFFFSSHEIASNPIWRGKRRVRTSCIIKEVKYSQNYSMFFPVNIFHLADGMSTHLLANIEEKITETEEKNFARNRKKQGNSQVLWGGMMSSCVVLLPSKVWKKNTGWGRKKKYEKCNKFYYYDVSTSLVCIKKANERFPAIYSGACGVQKVKKHCRE